MRRRNTHQKSFDVNAMASQISAASCMHQTIFRANIFRRNRAKLTIVTHYQTWNFHEKIQSDNG